MPVEGELGVASFLVGFFIYCGVGADMACVARTREALKKGSVGDDLFLPLSQLARVSCVMRRNRKSD
jgi:hypothetical protein